MKMNDITADEYTDSFNNNLTKKDMTGIIKNILRDVPLYIKLRFINEFNKILNDPTKIQNFSFGRD